MAAILSLRLGIFINSFRMYFFTNFSVFRYKIVKYSLNLDEYRQFMPEMRKIGIRKTLKKLKIRGPNLEILCDC